jgi:sporulation protein YlmC with PRC-barrel domain
MRKIAISAAAALAGLTIAAAAQTPTTPRPTTPSATPSVTQAAPKPAINPLTQDVVSNIDGTAVYGSDQDKIGHVSDVLMDPQSKKIDQLVVTAGGVLGIGGHRVAVPIDQFQWDSQKGAFTLAMTADKLKAMPEWTETGTTATGSTQPTTPTPSNAAGDSEKK